LAKPKERLDTVVVAQGLCTTKAIAQALIINGQIMVGGLKQTKPGTLVDPQVPLSRLGELPKYVSRGGLKLEGALQHWGIPVSGRWALDVGISTGGFSDCLLQSGAQGIIGLDVGYGQLDYRLRIDPRVNLIERCNARHLTVQRLSELGPDWQRISLVVMDVSFISVTKLLVPLATLFPTADFLILIKPQFEATPHEVGKGGIITDPDQISCILRRVDQALSTHFRLIDQVQSSIKGTKGNQETFFWLVPIQDKETP